MAMQQRMPAFSGAVTAIFSAVLTAAMPGPAHAQSYKVLAAVPDKMSGGTTAFVDALQRKSIIELDSSGKIVWQCSLAALNLYSGELRRATDLEWIAKDDTFLVAIPFSGVYRINRACAVTWSYRTSKVSHDADLLPNGNVLHAFAWDTQADSQAVEVDPAGRIVWSWKAYGKVDPAWVGEAAAREGRRGRGQGAGKGKGQGGGWGMDQGFGQGRGMGLGGGQGKGGGGARGGSRDADFTHANAVVRLADGDTLVSLRNFDRVARVAPDGSVRRFYGPINRVHDPSILPDGSLIAANHVPMSVIALGNGGRRVVFANEIGIKPIRTVEQLKGGNFLLTGGEDIVEIDGSGAVVWRVKIFTGLGARIRTGVYKAVRVAK